MNFFHFPSNNEQIIYNLIEKVTAASLEEKVGQTSTLSLLYDVIPRLWKRELRDETQNAE